MGEMGNLYIQTESILFLFVITVYLYSFWLKNTKFNLKEKNFIYSFLLATVVFTFMGNIAQGKLIKNICFTACAFGSTGTAYSLYKNAVCLKEINLSKLNKAVITILCFAFGILSFYLIKKGSNVSLFVLVFLAVLLLIEELYNTIKVDNLTKLYNRYGMDLELKEQLKQYKKEHTDSFYIISCDLDNFKHINDTWGHPEGDRALVLVAGVLSKVGKLFNSEVFRIGGDEFIIITDTSEEGLANKVEETIKKELDNIKFRDDFNIKMSIGIALYDGITAIDELINNADKKLYEAKKLK